MIDKVNVSRLLYYYPPDFSSIKHSVRAAHCNDHILAHNFVYSTPVIDAKNVLGMEFLLHFHYVEDVRIRDTQTVSELANALVDGIDEAPYSYAATISVNQN